MTNKYQEAIEKQFKIFWEIKIDETVDQVKVMKAVLTLSNHWKRNLQAWELEENEAWTM
jgi:hypothetical protein